MLITIGGNPESGKMTIAELLARQLACGVIRVRDLREKIAQQKGLTIDELNALSEYKTNLDTFVDKKVRALHNKENLIVVGRMAWYFLPKSFKIFLDVSERVATHRLYRAAPHVYGIEDNARTLLRQRIASDKRRFASQYSIDYEDPKHYQLWIDTNNSTPQEVIAIIMKHISKKQVLNKTRKSTQHL